MAVELSVAFIPVPEAVAVAVAEPAAVPVAEADGVAIMRSAGGHRKPGSE